MSHTSSCLSPVKEPLFFSEYPKTAFTLFIAHYLIAESGHAEQFDIQRRCAAELKLFMWAVASLFLPVWEWGFGSVQWVTEWESPCCNYHSGHTWSLHGWFPRAGQNLLLWIQSHTAFINVPLHNIMLMRDSLYHRATKCARRLFSFSGFRLIFHCRQFLTWIFIFVPTVGISRVGFPSKVCSGRQRSTCYWVDPSEQCPILTWRKLD